MPTLKELQEEAANRDALNRRRGNAARTAAQGINAAATAAAQRRRFAALPSSDSTATGEAATLDAPVVNAASAPIVPPHMLSSWDEPHDASEDDSGAIPKHYVVFPPEIYPIPDSQEFNPSGTTATTAAGQGNINMSPQVGPNSGQITLPGGNIGIIRSFTITIANCLSSTVVTFSLLVNGAPVAGYGAISVIPAVSPLILASFDCFIRLPDSAQIQVTYNQTDGGSYTLGARMSGWYHPLTGAVRWTRMGR